VKRRFPEAVLEEGARVVGRAASAILADPRGQEAMARAVGLAQRGLRLFGEVQERALHGAGCAARRDYHDLRKQVARLKRKAREMSERLEAAQGEGDAASTVGDGGVPGAGDGSR
jgi:hypothetical protein